MSKKDESNIDITSYDFFKDDIALLDKNIGMNEGLYDEIHDIFAKQKGISGTAFGSIRDLSELAKTLGTIRGTAVDIITKKISAKKIVSDIQLKKDGRKEEQNAFEQTSSLMRELTASIHSQNDGKNSQKTRYEMSQGIKTPVGSSNGRDLLDKRLQEELTAGNVKINANENAMKYDYAGVKYMYDKADAEVKAVNNEGHIIIDYPQERIPRDLMSITRVDENVAITEGGAEIPLFK